MENIEEWKIMKKVKEMSIGKFNKIIIILISFFITFLLGGLFLLYGPFDKVRTWLITTAMTTMNHQYLATFFYSDDTIREVMTKNRLIESGENTNTLLIDTNKINTKVYKDKYEKEILEHDSDEEYKMIEIKGDGYSGYLVAVYDPAKIRLVTSKNLGTSGEYLIDMAKREGASVAISAVN